MPLSPQAITIKEGEINDQGLRTFINNLEQQIIDLRQRLVDAEKKLNEQRRT